VLKALLLLVFYTYAFSTFLYLFVAWGNFSDMIQTIAYLITVTVTSLKKNVILFRSDEVQHIVKTVQENFFIHGTELSIENRKIIKNVIKQARQFTIAYATIQTTSAVVFLVGPLFAFDVMLQTHNATNISSETIVYERKLPVRFWTPLDVTRSPQFEFTYIHTVLAGCALTLYSVAVEMLCMTTFIYLTGQFELLCDSISNASEKVKYRIKKREHSSAGSNGITKRLKFTPDKKTKIQFSRADTETIGSAKGKRNIYATQQFSLKQVPIYFFSDILRILLLT
jgi:hypothetical protein